MIRLILAIILFSSIGLNAQSDQKITYKITDNAPIPRVGVVDPMNIKEDYFPNFDFVEAPSPGGGKYTELKTEIAKKYPRKATTAVSKRSTAQPPVIFENGFDPFSNQTGTPPDNAFGINKEGHNISAVNSKLAFKTETGGFLKAISLQGFSLGVAINAGKFDPRVIYDPVEDRFVMVWLAGNTSPESTIVVAFSSSSDIKEPWHLYGITGSPFGPGEWTDYPMISFSDNELFLTINLIKDNGSWQADFRQTIIYQIDKYTGFEGADLDMKTWSDINYDGKPIRNLHPVKAADEDLADDMYFLSNRNFDTENDSIFILRVTGALDNPDLALEIDVRKTDTEYGAPPNALQEVGTLATNDARVLDAFRKNDQIQYVGNTVHFDSGKAAIYHGTIDNLSTTKDVTSLTLTDDVRDMGYPAIAWTGSSDGDADCIIVTEYSSETENPGIQAIYMDEDKDYSEWAVIKSSPTYADMINGSTVERWGDYTGLQRRYDKPGEVWVSSAYVGTNNRYKTWVTGMTKPLETSTAEPSGKALGVEIFPNPTTERITVLIDLPNKDKLNLSLFDAQGRQVTQFLDSTPKKSGALEFSFDVGPLDTGAYLLVATQSGKVIASEKVVKN